MPEDWCEATEALAVSRDNFIEHEEQFEATKNELKWEWFSELELADDTDLKT